MNYLDVIIGLILLLFAYKGLKKGLIVEAFSLAAFIIGIYGAMYLSDITAKGLSKIIDAPQEIMTIIAFIITFIILAILVTLIGKLISKIVEALFLGFIDKIGGFVFGMVKGALLVSILILVLNFFGLTDIVDNKTKKNSFLYRSTESIAYYLYDNYDVVNKTIEKNIKKGIDTIEDFAEEINDQYIK